MIKREFFFYIVITIVFLALVIAGIVIIVQSNDIYAHSRAVTRELMDNKLPVIPPTYTMVKEGYAQALLYFTLAFGVVVVAMLLPRIQNLSISPTGITVLLQDIKKNVDHVITQGNVSQEVTVGEGGKKASTGHPRQKKRGDMINEDDPQKGRWGGKSENNHRVLKATVTPTSADGYYLVEIIVESNSPAKPLNGVVKFHLHPSFRNPDPVIVAKDNRAVLKLSRAFGAFTVGAEADDGSTLLELDLADLPDAPDQFKVN